MSSQSKYIDICSKYTAGNTIYSYLKEYYPSIDEFGEFDQIIDGYVDMMYEVFESDEKSEFSKKCADYISNTILRPFLKNKNVSEEEKLFVQKRVEEFEALDDVQEVKSKDQKSLENAEELKNNLKDIIKRALKSNNSNYKIAIKYGMIKLIVDRILSILQEKKGCDVEKLEIFKELKSLLDSNKSAFIVEYDGYLNRMKEDYTRIQKAAAEEIAKENQGYARNIEGENKRHQNSLSNIKNKTEQEINKLTLSTECSEKRGQYIHNVLFNLFTPQEQRWINSANKHNTQLDSVYEKIFNGFGETEKLAQGIFDWVYLQYAEPKCICGFKTQYSKDGIENQAVTVMSHGQLFYRSGFTNEGKSTKKGKIELLGITKNGKDETTTEFYFCDSGLLGMPYGDREESKNIRKFPNTPLIRNNRKWAQIIFSDPICIVAKLFNNNMLPFIGQDLNVSDEKKVNYDVSRQALQYANEYAGYILNEEDLEKLEKESKMSKRTIEESFIAGWLSDLLDQDALYERQLHAIERLWNQTQEVVRPNPPQDPQEFGGL